MEAPSEISIKLDLIADTTLGISEDYHRLSKTVDLSQRFEEIRMKLLSFQLYEIKIYEQSSLILVTR